MTKKIEMKGLPEFLKESEKLYGMNQGNGMAIHLTKNSNEKKKKAKMCGMCFGAHLADFFKTPLKEVYVSRLPWAAIESLDSLNSPGATISVRNYDDGVLALFNKIKQSPHFVESFRNRNSLDEKEAKAILRMSNEDGDLYNENGEYFNDAGDELQLYLHKECGAPRDCFSGRDWPDDTKPHEVAQKLLELNPAI